MEPCTELVIKVNYGSVLRRFRVPVNANGQLDIDMTHLREKIISLFNLPVDAELSLTYTDEDGDMVTLVDDNDLHDVVNQRLRFLKIYAQLKTGISIASSSAASSECSTPVVGLPHIEDHLTKIHEGLNEILMAVPNPLRDTISKVSMDLASSTVSSSPVVGEMLHCISKLGQVTHPRESSPSSLVTQTVSGDGGLPSGSTTSGPSSGREVLITNVPVVDLNLEPPSDGKGPSSCEQNVSKETRNQWRPFALSPSVPPKTTTFPASFLSFPGAGFNECPFSGTPVNCDSSPNFFNKHPPPSCPDKISFCKYHEHKGIRCDGCGVLPITGPRFMSKLKEDYDLCSTCFSQMGNERDYIRMDEPASVRVFRKTTGPAMIGHKPRVSYPAPVQSLPQGGLRFRTGRLKLDSRFVCDVNVIDGTIVAPSTPFTKIWRMRNNGSLVWPRGTQLVWIGGDRFGNSVSVDLEGVGIDSEIDVAVDFVAPETPGRYISYWRMASSSGVKFGQRVWVLIHVDASLKNSVVSGFHGLNLNASPDEDSSSEVSILEALTPIADLKPKVEESEAMEKNGLRIGKVPPPISHPKHAPSSSSSQIIDLTELIAPAKASHGPSSSKEIPISFDKCKEVSGSEQDLLTGLDGKNDVEQALLKELEEMGFKEIDLNKEILRKNEYNLEQSVDALCGVSDWDPILEELQEMGFHDNETNKRLLKKNNGSIKGVVLDLLAGEKA
ncbi:PREDICTED: protein NBR1 homolog [Tarenaya hassleriana]|uniref:protein NBR1 homolog n=1 Tax=Tarenaya hassleriana TaxID=28532 RepID=UPI00053C6D89|nr:PREDICTED: protein NBR1 homolog [Tarenaya hassleriana]